MPAVVSEPTTISLSRGAPSLDIIAVEDLKRRRADAPSSATPPAPSPTAPRRATRGCWTGSRPSTASSQDRVVATNGSMQADAFLFQALVQSGRRRRRRGAHLRPHAAVADASSAPRCCRSRSRPTASTSARSRRRSKAGARPVLAHIIPNFQNPAGCTLSLAEAPPPAAARARVRVHDLRGRPVRRAALRGRAAADDAVARRERRARRLRVLVLEDGLPGHPRRLPGRPRGADRARAHARHPHLHLAEHGRPVDRRRVLRVGRDRAARSRPSRRRCASGATRPAARSSSTSPRRASSCPRAATSSGSTCPRAPTSPRSPRAPRSAASCSCKGTDFLLEGGENSLRLAYSAVSPEQIEEAIARVGEVYRQLPSAA